MNAIYPTFVILSISVVKSIFGVINASLHSDIL